MALGVLNNLSAIYAENNLNNTNNSLQTVLQQLSSGSKINSGADDAAGLSLVNGLEANSAALTQSRPTPLKALACSRSPMARCRRSQACWTVPSRWRLRPRTARSIARRKARPIRSTSRSLAEVNNIGSTTTYNQQQVFNGQAGRRLHRRLVLDRLFGRRLEHSHPQPIQCRRQRRRDVLWQWRCRHRYQCVPGPVE